MSNPAARLPNSNTAPTGVRHLVVGATMLVAVLLYLDRFCISFAEIYIKEDLGLSDTQIGWMLSAFFWTYALAQVPSGWLSDRFGARNMLAIYILLWSLFTGLTGVAGAFSAILLLRLGFGLGQAGAYPTSANLVSKWVPFSARGTASSLIAVGGRFGGALAPVLTAMLIVVFVPSGVSSLLEPRDLLNPPLLCHDLVNGNDETAAMDAASAGGAPPVGERIVAGLTTEQQEQVKLVAERYAQQLERRQQGQPAETAVAASPPLIAALIDRLNEVVRQPDFFSTAELTAISLPQEGKTLRDRRAAESLSGKVPAEGGQAHFAQSPAENEPVPDTFQTGSELTLQQAERLNRLALESAYRESLRKVYGAGWRPVMMVYGGVGLLVAGLFWLICRDRPGVHPAVNDAELALIRHGRIEKSPSDDGPVGAAPVLLLMTSLSMWLNCLMQFCTNVGWVFLVTWLPRYLASEHHIPIEQRGWMSFIPLVVGWFGMVSGGRLTDWLVGKAGLRWGRSLPMSCSRFLAMAAYVYCFFFTPSAWVAVAALSVVAFATDLGTGATWAFSQDVGGKHSGSVLGWGNMFGNFGAAVAPPLMIWIVNESGNWTWAAALSTGSQQNWGLAFLTCALAFLISGLAALGVDATKPIAPREE